MLDRPRDAIRQRPRGPDSVWERRRDVALSVVGWALITGGVVWLASHIVHTLLMLVIAALLAYALAPAVTLLKRFLPKWASVLIVYILVLAIVAGVFTLIISTIVTEVTALAAVLSHTLTSDPTAASSPLYTTLRRFGISSNQITTARDWAASQLAGAAGVAAPIVTGVLNGLLDFILITVLSIYLLIDGPRVIAWLHREMPIAQRPLGAFLLETVQQVAGGYIRGELILCSLIGFLVWAGMQVLGVPFAILLGVLAFFFEFIPFLGPWMSAAACLVVGISQGWLTVALILVYFVAIHIVEGYIIGPRILGRSLGLHPAISIVALLIGGEVFGLWGALFAAPLAGIIQVLLSTFWREWREAHPTLFPAESEHGVDITDAATPTTSPTSQADAAPQTTPEPEGVSG